MSTAVTAALRTTRSVPVPTRSKEWTGRTKLLVTVTLASGTWAAVIAIAEALIN